MKKVILFFLCFCITFLTFAESNVKLNKEMYVKENLRLRTEESTSSSIIDVMRIGSKIKIIKLGKEEIIDKINSNWVQIEVLDGKSKEGKTITKGTKGWCFGGYLAEYVGKYDYIDLTDRDYKIRKIDFKSKSDETAWYKLAGYYFFDSPRKIIYEPEEELTPWGRDYIIWDHGCSYISYADGIWGYSCGGDCEEYELESISTDGKTFFMKNKYNYHTSWKIDGEYLYIGSYRYYKFTGPDCYKKFLKKSVRNYNESIKPYQNISYENKVLVSKVSLKILKALSSGNIKTYSKYVPKNSNVKIKIGNYQYNTDFSYNDLLKETEEVKAAFAFMKDDFSSHLNELDSIQPNINEFLRTTTVAMKQDFPEADIIVEYIIDYYAEVEFFFKKDKDSVIFIGLKEYAGFGL